MSVFINPFYLIRKSLFKSIRKLAPKLSGKLLDFGCGSKPYKNLFVNTSEYIGLDIENDGHSHEKEDVDVYYVGKKVPFDDSSFDSVFCSEVLEHVFNLDEILLEIKRVLKKDGQALFTLPFAWNEHEIPNDFARYTSFGIKHILEKYDFEIIHFEKTSHFSVVVFQLFAEYMRGLLFTKNKYVNIIINLIFIFPITLLGIIVSIILPKDKKMYFNNVVLVKNKK